MSCVAKKLVFNINTNIKIGSENVKEKDSKNKLLFNAYFLLVSLLSFQISSLQERRQSDCFPENKLSENLWRKNECFLIKSKEHIHNFIRYAHNKKTALFWAELPAQLVYFI